MLSVVFDLSPVESTKSAIAVLDSWILITCYIVISVYNTKVKCSCKLEGLRELTSSIVSFTMNRTVVTSLS